MEKIDGKLQVSQVLKERYRIEQVLGTGGMSAVYLAEDLKLRGKRWAIKQSFHQPAQPEHDMAEMDILIQLDHPHLPSIIDYYPPDEDGYSYVVMDYIQGQTLEKLFEAKKKRLSIERVLKYAVQLCDLLGYLHQFEPTPIIYRDLKPSNIIVSRQDHIHLIDFGIARHYKLGQQHDTIPMGTIGFAAPEQFEDGQQTDHRTDLYNLGALLYYLLSGGRFFYMTDKPLSTYADHLPYSLEQMIHKLLQTDPSDRFQEVEEVQQRLKQCMAFDTTVQINEAATAPLTPYKTIVIGSLHEGAGSTFAAIALARVLHAYGVNHALLEYPTNTPQLYKLLYGERFVPKDYVYLEEQLQMATTGQRKEWQTGETTWLPLNPHKKALINGSKEHGFRLLYAAKSPITIIDISTHWSEPSVNALCLDADEVICVADGHPEHFSDETTQQHLTYAYKLKELHKSVHFVANRYVASIAPKEWLQAFPWSPLCKLPNIAYEHMMQAVWQQRLVYDDPHILQQLKEGYYPFLKRILPRAILKERHKRKGREMR